MSRKRDEEIRKKGEILEYFVEADRELRKNPNQPLKRRKPKVTRHQSREQRIVETQTKNPIRAAYQPESRWNVTPTLPDDAVTTREVGPNDRYNSRNNYRAGKDTNTATGAGNKTAYRGRRAYGGGNNRKTLEELMEEYL